jgi:class 3 adenylate cyclase
VDDDALNREMLGRRLSRLGYEIDYAANGRLALEVLRDKPFDVVLLDILMPELNGFQTLEFIKADPQLHDLPVIMLTALDEVDSMVRAIEAGAEDCVPKPFNPVILNARLAASLEKKRLRDKERAFLRELESERAKSERLLLNTLPKAIADRLKAGERVIVDSFAEATVLFADIAGFTRISADMAPRRTMQLLNEIFSALDRLAETYGVEKIKTIGDAYMAVGGVPVCQPNHAEACANLAVDILATMRAFNRRHDVRWQVRIGMHSGPLVAGIIGTKKFAYDLWGDTVNIASRMESQGESGCIQVSARTRQLLEGKFRFEERGTLEMKNRGPIAVYHLKPAKG